MTALATIDRKAARRERRASSRRRLCLEAEAEISAGSITPVVIHELSRSGFLMVTAGSAKIGERVHLRLVDAEAVWARVVWSCGDHFGCEFQRPLSSAIVSAALLKARPAQATEALPPRLHFDPPGVLEEHAGSREGSELRPIVAFCALLWTLVGALVLQAL